MFSKKVLVAGCGKSGICAGELLARNGEKVILFDENKNIRPDDIREKLKDIPGKENIEIYIGDINDDIISRCEIMVISPGIPVDKEFVKKVKSEGLPVWSEIELAYHYEKGKVLAITGTNGKTTTTTLVGEIMKAYNPETFVVGNIGIPYTKMADKTTENSVTVAEISSFQLETIVDFAPRISAILNVTPDHLNRHYTFENYAECKKNITKNQGMDDYAILNYDDPETVKLASQIHTRIIYFSRLKKLDEGVYVDRDDVLVKYNDKVTRVLSLNDIKLLGNHNVENVLAAVAMTYFIGVPVEIIERVCKEFRGVEHRIEYVKTINGVAYYNDSKGTNPDAAIKGIQAMTTTTLLIGGGYDKKVPFDEWIDAFDAKVRYLVLMGETADAIELCAKQHGFYSIIRVDSLEEAVEFCYKNAKPGDAVLLSPACASWDMFESYEQRGNLFKEYVKNLEE